MHCSKSFFSFLLLFTFISPLLHASEKISVWSYYDMEPFSTGDTSGLSYEFVELMNQYAKGKYTFELKIEPRSRIDIHLKENKPGMVLFVFPKWFGKDSESKYIWSEELLIDRNLIASRSTGKDPLKLTANDVTSMTGLTLGAVRGHKYLLLQDALKSGRINRVDVRHMGQNLELLTRNRIDFSITNASISDFLSKKQGLEDKVYFAPATPNGYSRHILITQSAKHASPFINELVSFLKNNETWHSLVKKYSAHLPGTVL